MMRRKKLFALLCVALSMFLMLAACGNKGPVDPDGGEENKPPADEYTLECPDGYRQLTVYYNRAAGYADSDVWLWYAATDGRGYAWHECKYGGVVIVNVPEDVEEVGFIIRTGCSEPGGTSWGSANKDGTDSDRFVKLEGKYTVIYTKAGDANSYSSTDGGNTLKVIKSIGLADMQDLSRIKIVMSDMSMLNAEDVKIKDAEGNVLEIEKFVNNVATMKEPLDVSKAYTVEVPELDPAGVVPLTYFSSAQFESQYGYEGELGVALGADSTVFRLWAPTASSVKLNLYEKGSGGTAYETVNMTSGDKGVWTHSYAANLAGKYYTYTVTTSLGTNEAVDPYARSAGLNGMRGMIVDLDATDPAGWSNTPFDPGTENYTDAQIWEVHVRDFSNNIKSSQYKGKYLAFTESGLTNDSGVAVGVDYLVDLGITHVHLLPSFDYASVDESKEGGFNWGYDPQNYNVPEGSYSTDAADGAKRVNEYKRMVQALHNRGIGVVMDVVYNHTYSLDSNLNKIVPYYYYRYNILGAASNGSGCGNETASDRIMMRKYIVDSVKYWQSEYNLDGFRFDLMALHDITTMQEVEKAVHAVNPKALIYGEGWTGGTSALAANKQAKQDNLITLNKGTSNDGVNGVAMFNDVIRDAVKGSVFNIEDTGFATGAKAGCLPNILFGVGGNYHYSDFGSSKGWYAANPTQIINYVSAHDNNTLWDRICHVYGEEKDTLDTRTAMNRLSAAIVQTSLGIPFMQAGEEMLRTKKNEDGSYNENSYNSPDSVNNIDWEALTETSVQYATMQYYKGLIAFRKSSAALRLPAAVQNDGDHEVCKLVVKDGAFVMFTITDFESGETLLVVYNAKTEAVTNELPEGSWDLYIDGTRAGTTVLSSAQSGEKEFAPISCYVYKLAA